MQKGGKNISGNIDITERTVAYSIRVIKLYRQIAKDNVGRVIGKQILRSATSIGANVHEAQGAQSKADFIAKMSIAHKEAYETSYWIRIISEAGLVKPDKLSALEDETVQIVKILSSILITSKNNK